MACHSITYHSSQRGTAHPSWPLGHRRMRKGREETKGWLDWCSVSAGISVEVARGSSEEVPKQELRFAPMQGDSLFMWTICFNCFRVCWRRTTTYVCFKFHNFPGASPDPLQLFVPLPPGRTRPIHPDKLAYCECSVFDTLITVGIVCFGDGLGSLTHAPVCVQLVNNHVSPSQTGL